MLRAETWKSEGQLCFVSVNDPHSSLPVELLGQIHEFQIFIMSFMCVFVCVCIYIYIFIK